MYHTTLASEHPVILGILGESVLYNYNHINQLTDLIMEKWGKPARILMQKGGHIGMHIDAWAEDNGISVATVKPNWIVHGPRAYIVANNRIENEATHVVIIKSPHAKYNANEELPGKLKNTITLVNYDANDSIVVELC